MPFSFECLEELEKLHALAERLYLQLAIPSCVETCFINAYSITYRESSVDAMQHNIVLSIYTPLVYMLCEFLHL